MSSAESVLDSDAPPPRLGMARAVALQVAGRWTAQVLSWASTILVARFVSPESYGIIGMSAVVVAFTTMLTDFGIGTTVITRRDLSNRVIAQLHSVSLGVGLLLTVAVCALAPTIGSLYREPRVAPVLWVLSVNFLLAGATTVPLSLLKRDLRFNTVTAIDFARATVGAVAVLLLAMAGLQFWALAIGNVVAATAAGVWALRAGWVRPARPVMDELRETLQTSRDFLLGTLAWFGYSNADALVLGRMGGAAILGQYRFARSLASLPGEKIVNIVGNVSLPIFSAISSREREVAALLLDLTELLSLAIIPALTFGAVGAPWLVPTIFGAVWHDAITPFQVLCVAAMVQNFQVVNSQVLRCRGLARAGRVIGLVALAVLPVLFAFGARLDGARGVAIAWLLGQPMLFLWPLLIIRRDLNLSLRAYARRFVPAIGGGVLVLAAALAVQMASFTGVSDSLRMLVGGGLGLALFLGIMYARRRDRVLSILQRLKDR